MYKGPQYEPDKEDFWYWIVFGLPLRLIGVAILVILLFSISPILLIIAIVLAILKTVGPKILK